MKRILPYLLAILSGLLPFIALETSFSLPTMLVAYIPLLFAESLIATDARYRALKVFFIAFICFFLANVLSLYPFDRLLSHWIYLYAFFSAVCISFVFVLFSVLKVRVGMAWGYASWLVFMLAAEYWSLNTIFAFPCMLAGVLAFGSGNTALIQWYEYTGVLGGSLWIFSCNLLLFLLLKRYGETRSFATLVKPVAVWLACVVLPVIFSLVLYMRYSEKENPVEALIVQPNVDPYTEKFSENPAELLSMMLLQAKEQMTEQTAYVIFPETAVQGNLWVNNAEESDIVRAVCDSLLMDYPGAHLIAGADMMQYYVAQDGKAPTSTAKKIDEKVYYDFFNVAMQVDANGKVQVYKKSKLVLGTEYVPFVQRFPALESWVINLGGSAQSRGRQERPSLLVSDAAAVAPVICFESLFGEYVSKFVKIGAELICVISNDGWWDEHPIPTRHVRFAQLRAIENRRSVMRCANTGISCFIDQRGDTYDTTAWWTKTNVKGKVNKNDQLTFYSRHGDYIGKIAAGCSFVLLCMLLWRIVKGRRSKTKQN